MNEELEGEIILRKLNKSQDEPFIYSTWPRSLFYSPAEPIKIKKSLFIKQMLKYIDQALDNFQITIACLKEYPDSIIGYSVIHKNTLEWIYIKEAYRHSGIATFLLKKHKIDDFNPSHLTKIGQGIINEKKLFKKKEELQNE